MTGPPRIVIDANVFVSAFLFRGNPALVLDLVDEGTVLLVHCRILHDEVERTLIRKFGWSQDKIRPACREYWESGIFVTPAGVLRVSADPQDDYLLECAMEARAQFIVTGDNDLLRMGGYAGCEILSPKAFLDRMQSQSDERQS